MTTSVAVVSDVAKKINSLVSDAKKLWKAKNHIQLGRVFAELRKATANYKKGDKNGISYSQAAGLTGVPHSSAEFLRNLAETCDAAKLHEDIFLALSDSGVNLAAERFQVEPPAIDREDVRALDVCDAEAVKKLVTLLKKNYPPLEKETFTHSERMTKLEKDLSDVQNTTTGSERVKETLASAAASLTKQIAAARSKMKSEIAEAAKELARLIEIATPTDMPDKDFFSSLDWLGDDPASTPDNALTAECQALIDAAAKVILPKKSQGSVKHSAKKTAKE